MPGRFSIRGHLLLFCLCFILAAGRDYESLIHPPLFGEDASELFSYFFSNPYFADVFKWHAGYASLLPNLVAWTAVVALPLPWIPHGFLFASLGFSAVAWSFFHLPLFRPVLPSDGMRFGVCVVMAIAMVGSYPLTAALMHVNWHALFLLALLPLIEPPGRLWGMAVLVVLAAVLAATHPLAVLLVPAFLWRAWRCRGRRRAFFLVLAAGCLVYLPWGVDWAGMAGRPQRPLLEAALAAGSILLRRVVAEAAVGNAAGIGLWAAAPAVTAALSAAALLAVWAAARPRGAAAWLVCAIVGLTAASTVSRNLPADLLGNFRYLYVQKLLLIVLVGMAVATWLPVRRRTALILLVPWLLVVNAGAWTSQVAATFLGPGRGAELAVFLRQVARQEETGMGVHAIQPDPRLPEHPVHLIRPPAGDPAEGTRYPEAHTLREAIWAAGREVPDQAAAAARVALVGPFALHRPLFASAGDAPLELARALGYDGTPDGLAGWCDRDPRVCDLWRRAMLWQPVTSRLPR